MQLAKIVMNIFMNVIGFKSFSDLAQSPLGLKHKLTAIYAAGFTISGLVVWIEHAIDTYIYSPALGVGILFMVTFFDMLLGISEGISSGEGLIPSKLSRAAVRVIVQTFFVAFAYQMHIAWGYVITYWMVDALLIIFTLTTFYSAMQNANKLGLITDEQYSFIESIVNIRRLIDKIKKSRK